MINKRNLWQRENWIDDDNTNSEKEPLWSVAYEKAALVKISKNIAYVRVGLRIFEI